VDRFDFAYVRFGGARYGREALARLEASAAGPDAATIRVRIAAVRKLQGPWILDNDMPAPASLAENIRAWPSGARVPETFLRMDWRALPDYPSLPGCIRERDKACDAFLLDLTGDEKPEIVLVSSTQGPFVIMQETAPGHWEAVAHLPPNLAGCAPLHEALREGNVRVVPPRLHDIEVAGQRLPAQARTHAILRCAAR